MSLFQKAKNESAFLKMGLYGSNGSGKTYTASLVAIGLHGLIKAKKPVFFLDSETGSDYVIPLFARHKVPFESAKSRSFGVLKDAIAEATKSASILIVDSVSHFWDDVMETYKKEKKKSRLAFNDWAEIKPKWREEFSGPYVQAPLHFIICGRQGDVWEEEVDDDGVKELKRTGVRMRTEKELGYEPSLLVNMDIKRTVNGKGWIHRAFVEKDRFDVMTFKEFDNPTFDSFLPHIENLNLGGKHVAYKEGDGESKVFESDNSGYHIQKQREIALDEIAEEIKYLYPGQTAQDKKERADLMMDMFQTKSWTAVQNIRDLELLKAVRETLKIKSAEKAAKEREEAQHVNA